MTEEKKERLKQLQKETEETEKILDKMIKEKKQLEIQEAIETTQEELKSLLETKNRYYPDNLDIHHITFYWEKYSGCIITQDKCFVPANSEEKYDEEELQKFYKLLKEKEIKALVFTNKKNQIYVYGEYTWQEEIIIIYEDGYIRHWGLW